MSEREDMILKLGLSMLNIGFSMDEIKAVLNTLSISYATEVLSRINEQRRTEQQ